MAGELTVVQQQPTSALVSFDGGSIRDMQARLDEIEAKMKLAQEFFKKVMDKDTDYGIIPGTQKPSLLQPGADKLNALYGFAKTIVSKDENKDYVTGHYDVSVKVRLVHKGSQVVAGEGEGSASTRESKYRYRWVYEKDIPRGLDKETLFYKEKNGEYGPYKHYRIENDDLFSQWNTVLKMAIKRAYVGATLAATGLSGLFSQAENELDAWIEGEAVGDTQQGQQSQRQGQQQTRNRQRGGSPPAGGATEKQIGAIFGAAKGRGLSTDEAKEMVINKTGKETNQLTKQEASSLIGWLQSATMDEINTLLGSGIDSPGGDDIPPELFSDFGGR
ncbi:hypothetical protein [Desulforamulus aquiferis]|uniref:Uncharacterized protein n=1 Tax=Desulforamulus aquiferis TaxID=1397668 RepID=A0AAW7ZJ67_9FIRM|nr:hypothetical protein [Desulforamulus aquiferis]MDO7789131.1 hypothetical protein [Desulforamulus aquiferis]